MPNVKETSSIIDILRKMTSKELAVVLIVAGTAVGGSFWFENRYAKLADTQTNIQQQQTQILQLQTQILTVVNSLPADVRKEIVERSTASKALNLEQGAFIPQNKPHSSQ